MCFSKHCFGSLASINQTWQQEFDMKINSNQLKEKESEIILQEKKKTKTKPNNKNIKKSQSFKTALWIQVLLVDSWKGKQMLQIAHELKNT